MIRPNLHFRWTDFRENYNRGISCFPRYNFYALRIWRSEEVDVNWLFRRRSLEDVSSYPASCVYLTIIAGSITLSRPTARFKSASARRSRRISVFIRSSCTSWISVSNHTVPELRRQSVISSVCTRTNYRRHAAASRCESPKCRREIRSTILRFLDRVGCDTKAWRKTPTNWHLCTRNWHRLHSLPLVGFSRLTTTRDR